MHTVTFIITSFNCKNMKTSVEEIQSLCNRCDVLLLQETWLLDFERPLLASIHKDIYSKGVSTIDSWKGIVQGRPHGGLAILWRKSLYSNAVPCLDDDSRIMGIEIGGYNSMILVVNTYLPCSSDNNLDMFNLYLNKLDSIVLTSNTVSNIIMGDFNADIKADSEGYHHQLFGRKLAAFCESNNLVLSDSLRLANMDTYTFVSHAHGTTSWLDHAMSTSSKDDLIDELGSFPHVCEA